MKKRVLLYTAFLVCSFFIFSSRYDTYRLKAANYQKFYANIRAQLDERERREVKAQPEKIKEEKNPAAPDFFVFHAGTSVKKPSGPNPVRLVSTQDKYFRTIVVKAGKPKFVAKVKDLKPRAGKSRKAVFIDTLVPIIEDIHKDIKLTRTRVEKIAKKGSRSKSDEIFLKELFLLYKVEGNSIAKLLDKLVIVPTSLVLAQASLESGWGTSQIAVGANNLFGMKSFSRDGRGYKMGKSYYKRYDSIKDSVEDYMLTLARHRAYGSLRNAIIKGENSTELVRHLNNYSELKAEYGRKVGQVIRANNLYSYDA
jgi:Bax protein